MKRFASTFLLSAAFGLATFAQITLTPTSVELNPTPSQTDVHSTLTMKNNDISTKTFKWERIVVNISQDCKTQVCDPNNCYLPSVSTKQFTLPGNGTGIMQVHFLNSTGQMAGALVHIKITEVGNDANTVTGVYIFNGNLVTGTDDAFAANVRLFPNPVTEYFSLENAEEVGSVRVFGMDGREVKTFDVAPGANYSLADVLPGQYIVVLQDKKGKAVKAVEVQKK